MSKKVLVTSCGGDIGQSVGKILKEMNYETYGMDISENNAAKFIFDHFQVGLRCDDINYIASIEKFVLDNQINLIIPVSEPELKFYSKNFTGVVEVGGAKVIMANDLVREIGFSKLKTSKILEKSELPFPKYYTADDYNIKFPLIAKPDFGSGSKNIFKVDDEVEMAFLSNKYKNLIFQEYLDGTNGEYTCGIYRSLKDRSIRTIIFKRDLTAIGYSGYGEVVDNQEITILLERVAKLLNLEGSINVQLRIHNNKPTIFEINPRFSSTILFRHLLGFKDLLWSIEDFLNVEISPYKKVGEGSKFYKGFNEYIVKT